MPRLAALLVAAALLAVALPASAASAPAPPTTIWFRSDGTWRAAPSTDGGVVLCSGTAPFQNSCHIDLSQYPGWRFGMRLPPPLAAGLPFDSGPAAYSARMTFHGGPVLVFECNFVGAEAKGLWLPPFLGIQCALLEHGGSGSPTSLDVHVGAVDPLAPIMFMDPDLPTLNAVEAGVGAWVVVGAPP